MNASLLDCKGLPCPQPVLLCKQQIDAQHPATLSVAVDNEAALQNVTRFLEHQGYQVGNEQTGRGEWRVMATRAEDAPTGDLPVAQADQAAAPPQDGRTLILLTSPGIGQGDPGLGERLMLNFLATLPEMGSRLWRMILVNGAVRLAVEGSPCLEALQKLEAAGVTILVCGTCLTHFGLLEKKAVGQTTNMLDVVTSLQLAEKVIRP